MSERDPNITDAFAEWDDRAGAYRVFLTRGDDPCEEDCGTCDGCRPTQDLFLEPEHLPKAALMPRLYRAAFCANPNDFKDQHVRDPIGWEKEARAKRAAKAVKAELKRIKEGKPGPDDWAVQVAIARLKR